MNESLKTALKLGLLVLVGSVIGFGPTVISVTQNAGKVVTAFAAEEYQAGASYLMDLARSNPWWTSLWESAGEAAMEAGNFSLAMEAYLEAYQRGDLSEDGQIDLGSTQYYLGDVEGAEATWLELSDSPSAMIKLADLYEEDGDLSRAIEFRSRYLALIESGPESGQLYYLGLLIAADSPPKALVYLDQASACLTAQRLVYDGATSTSCGRSGLMPFLRANASSPASPAPRCIFQFPAINGILFLSMFQFPSLSETERSVRLPFKNARV